MTYTALTRAGTLAPILSFLDRAGISVGHVLARAHLPPWITAEREALIPATSTVRIFEAALQDTHIPNLGLTAGERCTIDALGVFGRLIRSAPTLGAPR